MNRLGFQYAGLGRGYIKGNQISFLQPIACFGGLTVYLHKPPLDQILDPGSGQIFYLGSKKSIDAMISVLL